METPSSTRRVTRSHTFAASNDRKIEDSEKNVSKAKSRGQQQDQSTLIDITNDSPIVGLANGVILDTPLAKQRGSRVKNTPGSGEALLRGQVKTLLLKVEEEVELSKFSLETVELLAPSSLNMPQFQNLSGLASVAPSIVLQQSLIPQVVNHVIDGKNQESSESEKSLISRSLLLDFSDKSELSNESEECFSELSYEEVIESEEVSSCIEQPTEDDDASIWSMQMNASTHDEDDVEIVEDYSEDVEEEKEEEYDEGGMLLEELCGGLSKISMNERIAPNFSGKHTRFVYNSDDEFVKEEVQENFAQSASSSSILRLKGLPTPKGKHLRFYEEEQEKST
ncbi:hypothetical protein CR513_50575, partial [Mucuna pruriens]